MSFAAWTFLFGIAAVAGPIFAHFLAKPRYKRIPFTMLQFLRNSQVESHSRRNLRDLLILLMRCAIIILLALLFARPIIFIKPKPKEINSIYYLGLDDSASMSYSDNGKTFFDNMKDYATDYIVSANPDGIFNICSLASGNWNYGLSKQQALAYVHSFYIKDQRVNIGAFLSGLNNSQKNIKHQDEVSAYLISDFTSDFLQQFLNVQEPLLVDNIEYKIITPSDKINNVSITSANAAEFKKDKLAININLFNSSETRQNRVLYALINNEKAASMSIEINPMQSKICPLIIETDLIKESDSIIPIELVLSPSDNLTKDDKFYLAIQLPKQIEKNILLAETKTDEMFLLETAINTLSQSSDNNLLHVRRVSSAKLNASNLGWANIFICSKITNELSSIITHLSGFLQTGGRMIFLLSDEPVSDIAEKLFQNKILPALPLNYIKQQTNLEIRPSIEQFPDMDNDAMKALSNYRIDRIALNGYWDCQPLSESECLWRFQNQAGFMYYKQYEKGSCILINTSIDNSLGTLFKSNASVALCQCFLGRQNMIRNFNFATDESIILPIEESFIKNAEHAGLNQIWIQKSNGQKQAASISNSFLTIPNSDTTGWIKTIDKPILYTGVNLPSGETNMRQAVISDIDNTISRVFSTNQIEQTTTAESLNMKQPIYIWKYVIWILIILLISESALANRLKR